MAFFGGLSARLAQEAFNHFAGRFGRMLSFGVDSSTKTITLEVLFKGEDKPIQIRVEGYELVAGPEGNVLRFQNVSVSREWLQEAIAAALPRKELKLPPETPMSLLNMVL